MQCIASNCDIYSEFCIFEVPTLKAQAVFDKLVERYKLRFDPAKRQANLRLRKAGKATYRLFAYSPIDSKILIVLQRSAGQAVEDSETWSHIERTPRLQIMGYELVQLTRPEQEAPSWTWRLTQQRKSGYLSEAKQHINNKDLTKLVEHMRDIYRSCGFAGVRKDVRELTEAVESHFNRTMKDKMPLPQGWPVRHGYVKRKAVTTYPLADLVNKLTRSTTSKKRGVR